MERKFEVRKRITKTLEQLVQTKPLAEIKVTDLCRISGVPRSTFYTHYCDIYSVPQTMWDELMNPIMYKIGDSLTWDKGHRFMFNTLLKNKLFFTKISWENDYNSIPEYGYRGVYIAVKVNVERRKKHVWNNEELVKLDYTSKSLASMTTKWCRDGMVVPVKTIVQIFDEHIPVFIKNLCDK